MNRTKEIRVLRGRLYRIKREDKEKNEVKRLSGEIALLRPTNVQKVVGVFKRTAEGLGKMADTDSGKGKKSQFRLPSFDDVFN
jgi:hypothetical protein